MCTHASKWFLLILVYIYITLFFLLYPNALESPPGHPSASTLECILQLCESMLRYSWQARPTAAQILESPLFTLTAHEKSCVVVPTSPSVHGGMVETVVSNSSSPQSPSSSCSDDAAVKLKTGPGSPHDSPESTSSLLTTSIQYPTTTAASLCEMSHLKVPISAVRLCFFSKKK